MFNFVDKLPVAEFKRGDKVHLTDRTEALTFEVLSVALDQESKVFYRVVELTQFGKPNEYRRSVVPSNKVYQ